MIHEEFVTLQSMKCSTPLATAALLLAGCAAPSPAFQLRSPSPSHRAYADRLEEFALIVGDELTQQEQEDPHRSGPHATTCLPGPARRS